MTSLEMGGIGRLSKVWLSLSERKGGPCLDLRSNINTRHSYYSRDATGHQQSVDPTSTFDFSHNECKTRATCPLAQGQDHNQVPDLDHHSNP